jgi:hypothetical protein
VNGQACDRKLSPSAPSGLANAFSFENDIKPILNDANANGIWDNSATRVQLAAGPLTPGSNTITDPNNWIWFSSFGILNAYSYTSIVPLGGTTYQTAFAQICASNSCGGVNPTSVPPSTGNVQANSYPINRTLNHITKKSDADCPQTVQGTCDFSGNLGPAIGSGATACLGGVTGSACDLNVVKGKVVYDAGTTATSTAVTSANVNCVAGDVGKAVRIVGAAAGVIPAATTVSACVAGGLTLSNPANTTGTGEEMVLVDNTPAVGGGSTGGAVTEYTRFHCRIGAAQQQLDSLTGKSLNLEITQAINADSFTIVPVALRTAGSRCAVSTF